MSDFKMVESHSTDGSPPDLKQPRPLACVQCRQRKIKCNRQFPCLQCTQHALDCVPAIGPRPRRQRFPERHLLERIRRYEVLLKRNNIAFEPLHPTTGTGPVKPVAAQVSKRREDGHSDRQPVTTIPELTDQAVSKNRTVDFVEAIKWRRARSHATDGESSIGDDDEDNIPGHAVIEDLWEHTYHDNTHDEFLFGSNIGPGDITLSNLHPDQMQIMRLWQVYLDNVNPLLRVTHTPTLQTRILQSIGNISSIEPDLEVLMFSIYCIAIHSLDEEQCIELFVTPRSHLLNGYQFACRQALTRCKVLRTKNRDCLTALFLYLVSVATTTNPQTLSSMLAVALHIAQRNGIHLENTYSRYSIFESEMYRRLWWALVTFNHRICELSDYKSTPLLPTWDCRLPSNNNDSELFPDTHTMPMDRKEPTEAIFTVIRYQQMDYLRHNIAHVLFVNPCLKTILESNIEGLRTTVDSIDDQSVECLKPSKNPLHFMTIWTLYSLRARFQLLSTYSKTTSTQGNSADSIVPVRAATRMLECDTILLTSTQSRPFLWLVHFQHPMLAYVHILRFLKDHPGHEIASEAWSTMSANYQAHIPRIISTDGIFSLCARLILQAWNARETYLSESKLPVVEVPDIVLHIQEKMQQLRPEYMLPEQMGSLNVSLSSANTLPGTSLEYSHIHPNVYRLNDLGLLDYSSSSTLASMGVDERNLWVPMDNMY